MTEFCALSQWVLPFTVVGGIVMSTVIGYGMWRFGVSPVKLENQRLSQLNRELTQDLAEKSRWERFYFNAYVREQEAHARSKSLAREQLKALKRENNSRVSEESSSASQERSKPEENFEHTSENVSLDTFEGPNCPLENYIIDPDYVAAIFGFFSWVIWTTLFLLLSYRKGFWYLTFLWLSSLFHKIKPRILGGIKE